MRATKRPRKRAARHTRAAAKSEIAKVPLDQTRIEFDEDDELDETLSDARDDAHLDARHATQGKYE